MIDAIKENPTVSTVGAAAVGAAAGTAAGYMPKVELTSEDMLTLTKKAKQETNTGLVNTLNGIVEKLFKKSEDGKTMTAIEGAYDKLDDTAKNVLKTAGMDDATKATADNLTKAIAAYTKDNEFIEQGAEAIEKQIKTLEGNKTLSEALSKLLKDVDATDGKPATKALVDGFDAKADNVAKVLKEANINEKVENMADVIYKKAEELGKVISKDADGKDITTPVGDVIKNLTDQKTHFENTNTALETALKDNDSAISKLLKNLQDDQIKGIKKSKAIKYGLIGAAILAAITGFFAFSNKDTKANKVIS